MSGWIEFFQFNFQLSIKYAFDRGQKLRKLLYRLRVSSVFPNLQVSRVFVTSSINKYVAGAAESSEILSEKCLKQFFFWILIDVLGFLFCIHRYFFFRFTRGKVCVFFYGLNETMIWDCRKSHSDNVKTFWEFTKWIEDDGKRKGCAQFILQRNNSEINVRNNDTTHRTKPTELTFV